MSEDEIITGEVVGDDEPGPSLISSRIVDFDHVTDGVAFESGKFDRLKNEGEQWGREVAAIIYTVEGRSQLEKALTEKINEEKRKTSFFAKIGLKDEDYKRRAVHRLDLEYLRSGKLKGEEEILRKYFYARKYIKRGVVAEAGGVFSKMDSDEFTVYSKGFNEGWKSVIDESPYKDELLGETEKPWYIPDAEGK